MEDSTESLSPMKAIFYSNGSEIDQYDLYLFKNMLSNLIKSIA